MKKFDLDGLLQPLYKITDLIYNKGYSIWIIAAIILITILILITT